MKHLFAILVCSLLVAPTTSFAKDETTSTEPQAVTITKNQVAISAKGLDIRNVLFDLFQQTNQNFIIDDGVRHVLYLNLTDVTFQEALHIVLKHADLGYEQKDGIFYIGKSRNKNFKAATPPKTTTTPNKPTPTTAPTKGKISAQDLQKRLTTRMAMADIRAVFAEFGKQTGIKIEVHKDVPNYKIDAFLLDTSLKYALDVVTDAAQLKYTLTDEKTILITPNTKN